LPSTCNSRYDPQSSSNGLKEFNNNHPPSLEEVADANNYSVVSVNSESERGDSGMATPATTIARSSIASVGSAVRSCSSTPSVLTEAFWSGCLEGGCVDLSRLYVGSKTIHHKVLPWVAAQDGLRVLCFQGNSLTQECVVALCQVVAMHPAICELDLRDNPELTRTAGKALLRLVTSTPRIRCVRLEGTHVQQALQERIAAKVCSNRPPAAAPTAAADVLQPE
jgi:hypothetical protein